MYPTRGRDWSAENEIVRSIYDMTLDEYFIFCGGKITSIVEKDEEWPFDAEYLEHKKKLNHDKLDDELDEYMLEGLDVYLHGPRRYSPPNRFFKRGPLTLESLRVKYGIPEFDDPEPEEYPHDESYLKKKSFYTHAILDYELECYFYAYKAAGCLFYNFEKGKTYLLLQKKPGDPYYYDFGGKKEAGELFYECAGREVYEESNGILNLVGAKFRGIYNNYAFYLKGIKRGSYHFGSSNNDGPRTVGWYEYDSIRTQLSPRIPKIIVDGLKSRI